MNMGTPGSPESVEHWSNVAMFTKKWETYRQRQQGFWVAFMGCCGQCAGGEGLTVNFVNIQTDVTAVLREHADGHYRPDITLERGDKPPIWVEVTCTSPPSKQKLAYCAARRIDVYELDGDCRPVKNYVAKAHIAPRNCRLKERQRLYALWGHLRTLPREQMFIGIKRKSGSQQFIVGARSVTKSEFLAVAKVCEIFVSRIREYACSEGRPLPPCARDLSDQIDELASIKAEGDIWANVAPVTSEPVGFEFSEILALDVG